MESTLAPTIEFGMIVGSFVVTYLLLENVWTHLSHPIKMLLSMFVGTVAYTIGKLAVLALFFTPTTTTYGF
ncbi:MAG: hypothetical protein R3B92_01545 [Patescibacteria group bacterium]|uniref:Uncharacterized protein n=1 Tax=candidate division WWE3 bacterium TaxID=2053526 RepID=A0A955EDQ4_UNCKA|nr:hypothetical protein [candidate division WWE3 bacterium]